MTQQSMRNRKPPSVERTLSILAGLAVRKRKKPQRRR
jgi:hypothetical protein